MCFGARQAWTPAVASAATFGKTTVGASADTFISERKRVNRYALPAPGSVTKLSLYMVPSGTSGQQLMKGLLYADTGTAPGALLAVSEEFTFKSTNSAGWYDLVFSSPVKLAAGNYWIGVMTGTTAGIASFRWTSVAGSRDYNANAYASGPTNPFGAVTTDAEQASLYATYTPTETNAPPVNSAPPTISGTAQEAMTLTANPGSWSNSPTSYAYAWQRCDSAGANCAAISGAGSSTYNVAAADVGNTLRVSVIASNAAGPSTPASSAQTAVVTAPQPPANTSAPTISGTAQEAMTLTANPGSWSNSPTSYAYQWQRCDPKGANCAAISGAGSSTYNVAAADVGNTLRVSVIASNAAGPSTPASSAQTAVVTAPQPPANTSAPTISGTAQEAMTLTANPGSWSNSPTSYAYAWQRCDSAGANCAAISGAGASTYNVAAADVGNTIRVSVIASNAAGPSTPASSAQTAVVSAATGVQRLEYIFNDGTVSVYDIDQAYKLIRTISLPQTKTGVRGVTVAPNTHMLFVSYGGDGGPNGTGSVLAYDLVSDKVTWSVNLKTGIDSGQVSPDGKRLYMPTGELDSSGIWNILDTSNGAVIGTIQGGSGAHNTVLSNDGRFLYMAGRNYNNLDVYDTTTSKVREIGPLVNSVRPFTVNGSNTLSFTTATNFDGFQVSSITTAKVLFTVSFGAVPKGFPFTAPSHGASLSPDEKQLYVIDAVNKAVQVYDVSKVSQGVAPKQLAAIPVAGLSGTESPCAYDCGRGGWLQLSIDGRYLYVGDSGEVIDTSTLKVLTSIPTLLNTKKSLEVDWSGGVPVATSGRTGVGQVP